MILPLYTDILLETLLWIDLRNLNPSVICGKASQKVTKQTTNENDTGNQFSRYDHAGGESYRF